MFLPKPQMQEIVLIAACFHFYWNVRFTAYCLFRLKAKSCDILFKPSPEPVKKAKNNLIFLCFIFKPYSNMKYFNTFLSSWIDA